MPELGIFHHPTIAATSAALGAQFGTLGEAAEPLLAILQASLRRFAAGHHGDFERWQAALAELPAISLQSFEPADCVTLSGQSSAAQRIALEQALTVLRPWRKGPFKLFGLQIDSEWRSDWKWRRLAPALGNLGGQRLLDVGCGNGYFGWQLRHAGAKAVLGIDPTLLFCMQHLAINRYLRDDGNWVLPLRLEDLPLPAGQDLGFDGVLSMGVIYHRRSPLDHLQRLVRCLRPGGWLVLESLIAPASLYPASQAPAGADLSSMSAAHRGRYARMRNVWCVPSVALLQQWLQEAGLQQIEVLDVSVTSTGEQRRSAWMPFESLAEALCDENSELTVEGWPRPCRALLRAVRPAAEQSSEQPPDR